jgi:hypothetical protein
MLPGANSGMKRIKCSKNQAKLIAKINWAELTVKSLKYWRLPKILIYTQNIRFQSKYMRTS